MARFIKKCPKCEQDNNAAAKECQNCKIDIKSELPTILANGFSPRVIVLRETSEKIKITVKQPGGILGRQGTIGTDELMGQSAVSRRHLKIEYRNNQWWVEDLASVNGSRINGRKLIPGTAEKIDIDDVLFIATLKFVVGEEY